MASAKTNAPVRSGIRRLPGVRLSTRCRRASRTATRPIGMLTRKTRRQLESVTSRPPSEGPRPAAAAATADRSATPWERWFTGKAFSTRASEEGTRSAAPRAWRTRQATSSADRRRDRAEQRGGREELQAEDEHPAATQQVGDPSGGHEEGCEDDVVDVQHPAQRGDGRPRKRAGDVGEGDVDDRRVDERDTRAQRGDCQHRPRRRPTPADSPFDALHRRIFSTSDGK